MFNWQLGIHLPASRHHEICRNRLSASPSLLRQVTINCHDYDLWKTNYVILCIAVRLKGSTRKARKELHACNSQSFIKVLRCTNVIYSTPSSSRNRVHRLHSDNKISKKLRQTHSSKGSRGSKGCDNKNFSIKVTSWDRKLASSSIHPRPSAEKS